MLNIKQLLLVARLEAVLRHPSGRVGSNTVRVPHCIEPKAIMPVAPVPEMPRRLCRACIGPEPHRCYGRVIVTSYIVKRGGRLKKYNNMKSRQCSCRKK